MKHIQYVCFLFFFLFAVCFGYEEVVYFEDGYYEPICRDIEKITVWIPTLEYRRGNGRSYDLEYATLGSFVSRYSYPKSSYSFLDVQLHEVDKGHFAANFGVGRRWFSCCGDEMFGVNLYYDYRNIHSGNFQQFGIGFELLAPNWDFRINGYIPPGDQRQLIGGASIFNFTNTQFATRRKYKAAMWGLDVEIGGCLLSNCCMDVYGAIGPYCYKSLCCNSIIGGMGRISAQFTKYITFSLYMTYDSLFKTKVQGEISFSLLYPRTIECLKCAFIPVRRNRIIILEDVCLWDSNF